MACYRLRSSWAYLPNKASLRIWYCAIFMGSNSQARPWFHRTKAVPMILHAKHGRHTCKILLDYSPVGRIPAWAANGSPGIKATSQCCTVKALSHREPPFPPARKRTTHLSPAIQNEKHKRVPVKTHHRVRKFPAVTSQTSKQTGKGVRALSNPGLATSAPVSHQNPSLSRLSHAEAAGACFCAQSRKQTPEIRNQ